MATTWNQQNAALTVCIDGLCGGGTRGRIDGLGSGGTQRFEDLAAMLLAAERIMDRRGYPKAFARTRSFAPAAPPPEGVDTAAPPPDLHGAVDTVYLHILSRRQASWQGFFTDSHGARQDFSSALELLRLLEERLKPLR